MRSISGSSSPAPIADAVATTIAPHRAADRPCGARLAAAAGLSHRSWLSARRRSRDAPRRLRSRRPAISRTRSTARCSPRSRTACRWSRGPIARSPNGSVSSEDDVLDRLRQLADVRRGQALRLRRAPPHARLRRRTPWRFGTLPDDDVDAVAARLRRQSARDAVLPPAAPPARLAIQSLLHGARQERGARPSRRSTISISSPTPASTRQAVLFSTRCFKQRGAVLSRPARGDCMMRICDPTDRAIINGLQGGFPLDGAPVPRRRRASSA